MKRIITYSAYLILLTGAGCKTELAVINNSNGNAVGQPQCQHVDRFAWGLWKGRVNKPACDNGINNITVKTTFGEKLLTVITAGIYCPVEVEWFCESYNPPPHQ
jgi:hypothetical protein